MAHTQCGKKILRQIIKDGSSLCSTNSITQPLLYSGHGIRYRRLEVILTTSIEKLGKAGETVKVAPGYFRNHLMPKMLAVPNIEKFAYLVREQRKIYQTKEVEEVKVAPKTEEDKMKEYQTAATRLDNALLVLRRFITTGNDLHEPVAKDELVSEVARQLCIRIEPENLHLPSPLSTLGEFEVPLRLPKSIPLPEGKVQSTLNVKIRRK
ncbi:Ribosomal protein L9, N-terminal [Dillenia turbinata]|uniref:Large ribosomal subunit protein bL9c n=1 Tax=Dillenia turbinata TaxID=194707 RepID=A0AAN8ZGA8_9MAGN